MPLRCATYARYSSDRQSPASIDDQLRMCREHAQKQGWHMLEEHIYFERELSGAGADRPGWMKLQGIIRRRPCPFDVLLVDDTSRLCRNLGDNAKFTEEMAYLGIRVVAVSQGIDTQNKQAKVLMTFHYGSTLETRPYYIPSSCFETFPFPAILTSLGSIGERYHSHRGDIMSARREGLTAIYNRFHSRHEVSHDIAALRTLHIEMDHAAAAAYGWTDLDLDHGFHQTKQGIRYTISEASRRTVLDRLLALNHERYAAEQSAVAAAPRPKAKARKRAPEQAGLF